MKRKTGPGNHEHWSDNRLFLLAFALLVVSVLSVPLFFLFRADATGFLANGGVAADNLTAYDDSAADALTDLADNPEPDVPADSPADRAEDAALFQKDQDCYHSWVCSDWGECDSNGIQARVCTYSGTCPYERWRPTEARRCETAPIVTGPLFDVLLEIPQAYQTIKTGQELLLQIRLVNVGGPGRFDVLLRYTVKDANGNVILETSETVAVETQTSFIKELKLPPDIKEGVYTAQVRIIYGDNKEALSEYLFEVKKKGGELDLTLILAILLIAVAVIAYLKLKEKMKWYILKMRIRRKAAEGAPNL